MTVLLLRDPVRGMSHECRLIYQHCVVEQIPSRYYSDDEMLFGKVDLSDSTLVVGSVKTVSRALDWLSFETPPSNYYPIELQSYLYRNVYKSTIGGLFSKIANQIPVFAKPLDWKLFTGQVFDRDGGYSDILEFNNDIPVWLSDCVDWLSEYRVYVLNDKILAISNYSGDINITVDVTVIEYAIELLKPLQIASYAFDWGVLSNGKTALVEMNDGWAIGEYGDLTPKQYYQFLLARWDQMVSK